MFSIGIVGMVIELCKCTENLELYAENECFLWYVNHTSIKLFCFFFKSYLGWRKGKAQMFLLLEC